MERSLSIAELLEREDRLEPHEAVAIVQQLIHEAHDGLGEEPTVPAGPLSTDRVHLDADGSAVSVGSSATPAVSEVANLLQSMLSVGTPQVPGGLRYAIARALLDVDAPPFDSLEEFSGALARFERGDRREVVRKLLRRAAPAPHIVGLSRRPIPLFSARAGEGSAVSTHPAFPSPSDRRMSTVSVTELRRQLREADQRLFAQASLPQRVDSRKTLTPGRRVPALAAGVIVGMSLIGVGEAMHLRNAGDRGAISSQSPAAAPAPQVAEPAPVWQSTAPADAPKVIDRGQPRSPRTPAPVVHRRSVKSARAGASGSSADRARGKSHQTDAPGIFSHIKFKWVDDISSRRE
jgi:hypothetical protein